MIENRYQYKDLLVRHIDPYANAKYQIILDFLKRKKSLKILNAGCGSGDFSFLLARAGHKVLGIDPAPEYIDLAKKLMPKEFTTSCSFQRGSIEDFPLGERFDCVIAHDVLEHIKDDQEAANKLANLVRPEGSLILTVPAMQSLFGFHDNELGHFRRYSRDQLKKLINKTNLIKIEKIRYFGFTLIPVCVLFSKILRKPYPINSATAGKTFRGRVLNLLLKIDKFLPMPFGTSLILFGRRR
ncbi:MAG: hypothetical protein UW81_C0004G0057 [Candidatus Giovannonibacteria bacterium GW2011_GWC2_44_9]|uniref:Methyltransferase domain-containing protein n=3 Tax=Candidatus Giovannoniibacteriota TaxID=1752738 RepID=A0A0G1L6R5_9BACT|nr:MAG: hypothetical protein UW49_C0001G0068 [Candidatus Giovannonibacteria bacterium GW2011_GWB1_44_23]KKT64342.1 MAG: hypothetical protein UW57_C0001G0069 [Candidatus Giovannonibacteria bacterium GW2011_GWA1_44_29]KKT84296.1 MAG: hypothetical protein UW81_C0004G0057 [Candidatus Giovannonibacteria bacterium GW2011_GWC2_44_9]KKT92069.1 MAG: hypothetical protein UW93_C0001G0068 [Parcubacteria group bacterium GW2011_GWC1_45_13]